jgi:iron-sulfur cluster repair protein YtfE (RIC family)
MSLSYSPLISLAEVATQHPPASRVLQKFGLDDCRKGVRSLAPVDADLGLDAQAALAGLQMASESSPQRSFEHESHVLFPRSLGGE